MIEYAKSKDLLPKDTDLQCQICLEDIDLDSKKDGVPDCVICDNGHRCHQTCYQQYNTPNCPLCKNTKMKFCKSPLGYAYSPRKGGRGKKSKSKFYKKNKTYKRRKTLKRRKTHKRSKCY
jgi:hypothetical protein